MSGLTVTYEKPINHINLNEWWAKQHRNQQTNDLRRDEAFNLRHDSRQLRNETKVQTEWDTYHNNVRLADRVTELDRWSDTLKNCLEKIVKEIRYLKEEKMSTERELDALGVPLTVITECISMRDNRQGSELTYDEGDTELKKELKIVDSVKRLLKERCQATWEKINKLEEVYFKLSLDLNNKLEAKEIDNDQLTLDKNCANITFKTDPLRTVKNSITYDAWLEHSKRNKQLADNELADTNKLREALFVMRERARNDLRAQRDHTDFTLRKRVYETQKARNELEWQVFKIKEEMEKIMKEIEELEKAHLAKTDGLKLAETRLENRSYRPGMELERDIVEDGLKEEVVQLRKTRQRLEDQINRAKETFNNLEDQLVIMDKDLNNKEQSLMTDIKCLDMRLRLRTGEFAGPASDTDRNIQLTRMEKEIPPT